MPKACATTSASALSRNLAGVEVIIRINERVRQMEEEMERLRAELQSYRDRVLPAVHNEEPGTRNWEHREEPRV